MEKTEFTEKISFSLYCDADYCGFYSCINDFYDGGYPYKEYLDRENIKRLIDSGDMIITLAKDQTARIVGTSAALMMRGRFSGSVLLLLRSVVKDMRGKGIGSNQELFLFENIRRKFPNALSLYADVMTHDAVSQTTMLQRGFVFTGLRMALYKNEIMVPKLKFECGTKMTQAIYCKSCGKISNRTVCCPDEHRDTVTKIYSDLGVDVEFFDDEVTVGDCMYKIELSELHKKAEIFVSKNGDTARLENDVNSLILSGYTAVAYINMSVPGLQKTYNALKLIGFYFSGVKALSEECEYLVMSNTIQCVLNLENIHFPREAEPLYRVIEKEIKKYEV